MSHSKGSIKSEVLGGVQGDVGFLGCSRLYRFANAFPVFMLGKLEIVALLKVYPELGRVAKVLCKPYGRVSRDEPLAAQDRATRLCGTSSALAKARADNPNSSSSSPRISPG